MRGVAASRVSTIMGMALLMDLGGGQVVICCKRGNACYFGKETNG